jgi:hypothetical protein
VDDITESIACELKVQVMNLRVTAAVGMAVPIAPNATWYCRPVPKGYVMTHKYRGCIVVLSINKSVEPNEEQKVLMSRFDQGFTVNTRQTGFQG